MMPRYTSIGSYTIIYLDRLDRVFCGGCADESMTSGHRPGTYDEGPTLHCEECECEIESSYGEVA